MTFASAQDSFTLFVPAPSLTAQEHVRCTHFPASVEQDCPLFNPDITALRIFLDYVVTVGTSASEYVLNSEHVDLYVLLWASLGSTQQEEGKDMLLNAWVSQDAAIAAAKHVLFVLESHTLHAVR